MYLVGRSEEHRVQRAADGILLLLFFSILLQFCLSLNYFRTQVLNNEAPTSVHMKPVLTIHQLAPGHSWLDMGTVQIMLDMGSHCRCEFGM